MKDIKKDILVRIYLIFLLCIIWVLIIAGRILQFQLVEGKKIIAGADSVQVKVKDIVASRGNIYDYDGKLICTSVPIYDIYMDLTVDSLTDKIFNSEVSPLASCLYESSDKKSTTSLVIEQKLRKARKNKEACLLIKRNVSFEECQAMKRFPIFKRGQFKGGFIAREKEKRKQLYYPLANRTLGYVRESYLVGLEGAYDSILSGVNGRQIKRLKSKRPIVWLPVEGGTLSEPRNGYDLISTIDINMQDIAHHSLQRQLDSTWAEHGCVVLMEVKTGYVKAIANLTRKPDGTCVEDKNYAIYESSDPGSTFKLASVIALLELGAVDTNFIVQTGIHVYGTATKKTMYDSHREGYGRVSLKKAFKVSSNVGISQAVTHALSANHTDNVSLPQQQKFMDMLYKMTLNKKLGIEIPGESAPVIINPLSKDRLKRKVWNDNLSLPWISIGYGLNITPVQILALYNAVANNGVMVRPLFVKEILNEGGVLRKIGPVIINQKICSDNTLGKVRALLEEVTKKGGTAYKLFDSTYRIAGKTGTAQIFKEGKGYGNEDSDKSDIDYKASFVGYFPADNPKYSCIVVICKPKKKGIYYGGAVAAPVFKDIADKIYATDDELRQRTEFVRKYNACIPFVKASWVDDANRVCRELNIPLMLNNQAKGWVSVSATNGYVTEKPLVINSLMVPDVTGMGIKDALFLMEKNGLKVGIRGKGKGKVASQSVPAGTSINKVKNTMIYLNLI